VTRGAARYVLWVMFAINLLNYADRWVGSVVAPLIQKQFHLNDFQVGLLGSAFIIVYALAAIPFGYWADRGVRKVVIGVGVAVWSLATVASGFVGNFAQLFVARAVLGVGEASYYPAGTSLLSDSFLKDQRPRVMAIWDAGSAVGIAVGFAGGGAIASAFGWRAAFLCTAVPGLVLAILAFTMREPLRGASERAGPKVEHLREAGWAGYQKLIRIPTLRATILARTSLYFVLAAAAFWLPTLLGRRFGMTVGQAGLFSGVVLVLGGLAGTLLGAFLVDWFRRRGRNGDVTSLWVGIAGFLIGAVFMTISLVAPWRVGAVPIFVPAFFIAVLSLYLYSGPFDAVGQNVVSPGLRASAITLQLLVAHLLGDSYATAVVGAISDTLHSLMLALLVTCPPLLVLSAIFAAIGLPTVRRDTARMEAEWAEHAPDVPSTAPAL
jgi:MFS transporter, Spinster family, sphingosine-1-phosphate transporter